MRALYYPLPLIRTGHVVVVVVVIVLVLVVGVYYSGLVGDAFDLPWDLKKKQPNPTFQE